MTGTAGDSFAVGVIVVSGMLGLIWTLWEAWNLTRIRIQAPTSGDIQACSLADPLRDEREQDNDEKVKAMISIAKNISDGSDAFLRQEYRFLFFFIAIASSILGILVGPGTMVAFIVGSITSSICGYLGMKIAVYSNVRTCYEVWGDLGSGFHTALRAGGVMGFSLVSISVLTLLGLISIYRLPWFFGADAASQTHLFEAIAGYGLGGSSIALFARVGGGIYTKAADIGADLSGKNEYGMSEDDPRNPACIADNVGDNVGDIAGMGADLFGSLAESSCACLVIAAASFEAAGTAGEAKLESLATSYAGLLYPVIISASGILSGIPTVLAIRLFLPVRHVADIASALKVVLILSTVLESIIIYFVSYFFLPYSFNIENHGLVYWYEAMICMYMGLWSGMIIGYVTEYFTSNSYSPVRQISRTQMVSAATGIIYGLALGYLSTVFPVICLGISVCVAHQICGIYGIALAAIGMLSTLTVGLMIDAYGPVSDNAGGIAEMAALDEEVRVRTDALDAAGNTTAAIGKGYAIGSAALVSLALFGAFTVRAKIKTVDILDAWTFSGLLFGAMLPYAFSSMTMRSVGISANEMVEECLRQFPDIINNGVAPDYERCIEISTRSALKEMIYPGLLVIISPLAAGVIFGKNCVAGLLAGILVSGIQLAISSNNSGGAWDNAKKYIEAGGLGPDHAKGSLAHKNSVTGDTVGDPLKDTSGPSLNILVKLSAIISLVFGSFIAKNFSNETGGPIWA